MGWCCFVSKIEIGFTCQVTITRSRIMIIFLGEPETKTLFATGNPGGVDSQQWAQMRLFLDCLPLKNIVVFKCLSSFELRFIFTSLWVTVQKNHMTYGNFEHLVTTSILQNMKIKMVSFFRRVVEFSGASYIIPPRFAEFNSGWSVSTLYRKGPDLRAQICSPKRCSPKSGQNLREKTSFWKENSWIPLFP